MFNYKCPNGLPPEECGHIPQLIINVANYFKKKQKQRRDHAQGSNLNHINQHQNVEAASTQKIKRRG